jgi:hypothetical protein
MSAALAAPQLTMKLAWIGETWASPIRWPLSPRA